MGAPLRDFLSFLGAPPSTVASALCPPPFDGFLGFLEVVPSAFFVTWRTSTHLGFSAFTVAVQSASHTGSLRWSFSALFAATRSREVRLRFSC